MSHPPTELFSEKHPAAPVPETASMTIQEITLRPYIPSDATAFRELNEAWIRAYFGMEEIDFVTLGDPQGHILGPGGYIFVAAIAEEVVGCCALIPMQGGVFELAKMAVAGHLRGQGIGRKVLEYTIAQARLLGIDTLFLGSNTRLENAVHLYESVGFRHLGPEERPHSPYVRADVFMEMKL